MHIGPRRYKLRFGMGVAKRGLKGGLKVGLKVGLKWTENWGWGVD